MSERVTPVEATFDEAVRAHDRQLAALGLEVWLGGEPTFTDRYSSDHQWLGGALGGGKEERAQQFLARLARDRDGAVILRTVGRQYPDEKTPRWSFGVYSRRDGTPVWSGPADPVFGGTAARAAAGARDAARRLAAELARSLIARGASARLVSAGEEGVPLPLVFRPDGGPIDDGLALDEHLARPSVHARATPEEGLTDALVEKGFYLVVIGGAGSARREDGGRSRASGDATDGAPREPDRDASDGDLRLELPAFPDVAAFTGFLEVLSQAARASGIPQLIIGGYPPPVDDSVAWLTITPDPGVVEVNMAPAADVTAYLGESRRIWAAAGACDLHAFRLHFNGDVADSGGGGQLTFGGRSPAESPFFRFPCLLPRLIAYLNRHPALSYYFAFDSIGGSSQSPRVDEGVRESFDELAVALRLLGRQSEPTPATIWSSLAPFLTDRLGNSHRSEINIEKLWNPYLPGRGCLGLVELRALRMMSTPERAAATAALFRALIARLATCDAPSDLVDWGADLHDRFALPFYLRRDLRDVLDDLERCGFALGGPIADSVLDDEHRAIAELAFGDFALTLKRAVEFWPLIGDQSAHRGTSRVVDPSTVRVELCWRARDGASDSLERLAVGVDGYSATPAIEMADDGAVAVLGIRYRAFKPTLGLHPTLDGHGPLAVDFVDRPRGERHRLTLHSWRPDGEAYDGLPRDIDAARRRRRDRAVLERFTEEEPVPMASPPPGAATAHCIDTRRL